MGGTHCRNIYLGTPSFVMPLTETYLSPKDQLGNFSSMVLFHFLKLYNSSSLKREMFTGTYTRKEDFQQSRMLPDELLSVVSFGGD